jgi:uncharacterized protein involved in exopolysaccharide biosynthesis
MNEQVFATSSGHQHFSYTLRDVARVLFRHKRLMVLSFCGIFFGVIASALLLPMKYQAETKLLVKRERADAVVTPGQEVPVMFRDTVTEEELNSEVELMKSDDVLRKVVATCGLDKRRSISSLFGFGQTPEEKLAKAVVALRSDLQADPIKKTNMISVSYSNDDPKLAAKVLSTLDQVYVEKHVAVERPTGQYQFFEQETEQYKKDLDSAEEKLRDFSEQQHGVAPVVLRDLMLQKLNDFNGTLETTRASILETEKRIGELEKQSGITPARMTTQQRNTDDAQTLQTLKSTLMTLELKRTELLTKYQPDYPLVKEVDKELSDTKDALAKEESKPIHEETTDQNPTYAWIASELAKAKADLSSLQARETATQAIVNVYANTARDLDLKGLQQQDLVRAQKASEDNYLLYLKKREEARIADALDQTRILNVAIAQQPILPSLPSRSPWVFGALGCLLAAVTSVGTVFTVDYLDQSFRTPSEVISELKIPVLAAVPHFQTARVGSNGNNGFHHGGDGANGNGASVADGATITLPGIGKE